MRSRTAITTRRDGFSLIELLLVVAIVATLVALLIGAWGPGERMARTQKTRVILSTIRKGIELTIAAKGGAIAPAEHPFAGSKRPVGAAGFRFLGLRGRSPPDGARAGASWMPIGPGGGPAPSAP